MARRVRAQYPGLPQSAIRSSRLEQAIIFFRKKDSIRA
jgi:hypothetical protein